MNMYAGNEHPSALFDLLRAGKVAYLDVAYVSVVAQNVQRTYVHTFTHLCTCVAIYIHAHERARAQLRPGQDSPVVKQRAAIFRIIRS